MSDSEDVSRPYEESKCPNCGRVIGEEQLFCSAECERAWMKRELAKAEFEGIFFCPKCGSTKMTVVLPGLISTWKCKECGYQGGLAVKDGEIRDAIHRRYEQTRGKKGNSG